MVASKPFVNFFQHLSSICPNPKQKEHFRPQLSILCPPLHLAHFGLVSASLRHVEAICSYEQHNWQRLLVLAEKVTRSSLDISPVPKEINESLIQNMKLLISNGFSRCGFILFFLHGFIWGLLQFSQYTFNFTSNNNHLFNVSVGLDNTKFSYFLPQFCQKSTMMFCILYLTLLKNLIQPFIILLNLFLWFLFDGIQFEPNVININIAIFLHYPRTQFCLINKCKIQFLEPLFGLPLRFNLAILNNLSTFKSLTYAAIVSLLAQSFTSS